MYAKTTKHCRQPAGLLQSSPQNRQCQTLSLALPAGVLSLEHAAVSVAMRAEAGGSGDGDGGGLTGRFFVAAVSVAAELYVWRCTPAAGAERRVVSELLARVTVGASRSDKRNCVIGLQT